MIQKMLFDLLPNANEFKPIKTNDWKWLMAKDYPKENNRLKVFSCFACGGGSTMGYKLAGCDVIGCCEIDPKINKVYVANHKPKYNYVMDIRDFNKLPNNELPPELFNLDILDGSPPCTTFSMAGEREKNWGVVKKFKEGQKEQQLDDLSFVFIKTVEKLKPKVVIMENVEGLLLGKAWKYVQQIYSNFQMIGYKTKHYLLKGEQMGIPQTRHRVFFIALRNDIDFDLERLDMYFNYAPITYGKIKEGLLKEINKDSQVYKLLDYASPTDKSIFDIKKRLGLKPTAFQTYLIYDNMVLPTIRITPDLIDVKNKKYISKESIRNSQTFPTDYNFLSDSYQKISYICGMSVPPIMIKRIVSRLIEQKLFDYKEKI